LPATVCNAICAMSTALVSVAPPSLDPKAAMVARPSIDSNGTTTFPFVWTSDWPPRPCACALLSARGACHGR
jgi:hypothetical protein